MHNIILLPKSIFKRTQNVYGQNKESLFSMFFVEKLCWGCGASGGGGGGGGGGCAAACVHAGAKVIAIVAVVAVCMSVGVDTRGTME